VQKEKIVLTGCRKKKLSQSRERENSLTLNSAITCQCSRNNFFLGCLALSHTLGLKSYWNSSILYFVTTSLFLCHPNSNDVEKFIYLFFASPREREKRNLSMSGMSLGFCLKLTTFFYSEQCRGYFMSTRLYCLGSEWEARSEN
jgi:hypothetical protein